jgi:tetratricopeptide (TPR) repeat protein
MTRKNGTANGWLEQAYPEMHYMMLALDGDESALEWLRENSPGVDIVTRAMTGKRKALAALHADQPADLGDLFEVIDNEDLTDWLRERRPDVYLLFEAIQGDAHAMSQLKHRRPALARLALVVRELHDAHLKAQQDGSPLEGAAADMGCLVGEMHLSRGDYHKAIEAFTRAIETQPAADLYEGRARAYRGLALEDEKRAEQVRHKG